MKIEKKINGLLLPYNHIPGMVSLVFVLNLGLSGQISQMQALSLLVGALILCALRLALDNRAAALAIGTLASFTLSLKAEAKTYYVGLALGQQKSQLLGFYVDAGKAWPQQTGGPGIVHSSQNWILNDLNGGHLEHEDKKSALERV